MQHYKEGSTKEAIQCMAKKCLNKYNRKLHKINCQIANLQEESQNTIGSTLTPSPIALHEPISDRLKML